MNQNAATDRFALVTGASEGIGRAFAARLAREGWRVTCVARNEERLKSLIVELGNGHSLLVADLSTGDGVKAVCAAISAGKFDLLVNNAGFGHYGKFFRQSLATLDSILHVNCLALMHLSHAFLNVAKPGGALVNVSSALAFAPYPVGSVYAATKSFVTSLSESLWLEHKKRGIYVLGLCPGLTESKFNERAGGAQGKRPPAILFETADALVATAMKALKQRKSPTVISGWHNRVTLFLLRLLTRKRIVILMGNTA